MSRIVHCVYCDCYERGTVRRGAPGSRLASSPGRLLGHRAVPHPNFRRSLLCPLGTVQSLRCTDCGEIPTLDNIRVEELEGWTGTSPTVTTRLLWSSYTDAIAQGDHTRTADILALVELYALQFLKNPHRADAERGEGVVRAVLIPAGEVLLPRVIQLVLRGTPVVFIAYCAQ